MAGLRAWASNLFVALVIVTAVPLPRAAKAQGDAEEMPRFGETTREFEARRKGLPPPAREDPASLTVVADARGQFWVSASINGTAVRMMVDTGATLVVLSEQDARQIGIRPVAADFNHRSVTANGVVPVAPVVLREIAVGEITMTNVPAAVIPENRLAGSLLGMSFLSKLSRVEVAGGRLILKR